MAFLGLQKQWKKAWETYCRGRNGKISPNARQQEFAKAVSFLRTVIIRHTKSQQIQGDDALALPELESETVILTMSTTERQAYTAAAALDEKKPAFGNARRLGTLIGGAARTLVKRAHACANDYKNVIVQLNSERKIRDAGHWEHELFQINSNTIGRDPLYIYASRGDMHIKPRSTALLTKHQALAADLVQLQQEEPHMHAVVYTQVGSFADFIYCGFESFKVLNLLIFIAVGLRSLADLRSSAKENKPGCLRTDWLDQRIEAVSLGSLFI